MYPCPCGYYGNPVKPCTCSNMVMTKYQKRIPGSLLDRIDIHIEVPRVEYEKLSDDRYGESSAEVRKRIEAARQVQRERLVNRRVSEVTGVVMSNADMRPTEVWKYCNLDETSQPLMKSAMNQLQLSARAYHRVLKLACTIADLPGRKTIQSVHLAEAFQYRLRLMAG